MSDLEYESYREQQRELAIEELWRVLPDYYIHNTHEEIVNNIKVRLLLISKLEDEKTVGISKKIEKGLRIPPDKYNSKLN